MKKRFTVLLMLLWLPALLLAVEIPVTENVSSDVTWTADNTYILKGRIYVANSATLTIEPGTVIKAENGTGADIKSLIVTRGSKIMAVGTKDNPIIFTSVNDDVNDPDDMPWNTTNEWGGIAILGNAPINVTGGEDVFEAIPAGDDQELGKYGGDDENDSSGRMEYVSIRHGGAEVATDKEMNGLSLAGVGRGTKLSHIEVFSSSDDAFEWWGGTVNADHLVAAFCQDESYDLDEGNQSRLQFIFAIRNSVKQHIGEHDGAPADTPGNEPKAYTQIYNATYLGGGIEGTDEKSMFRLRENWGGAYKNCIFGDYHGTAVKIDSGVTTPDSYDRLMAGELLFNNNLFFNFSEGSDWSSLCEGGQFVVDYFSDASNGNTFGDPLFMSISRANDDNLTLDPRPKVGSPAYENLAAYPEDDEFFTPVDYKGAFDSENWMVEWTALEHYGFLDGEIHAGGEEIAVTENITSDTRWMAGNTYILKGRIYVANSATLTIEPGTVIKAENGTGADIKSLIVTRGSKIMAVGTKDNPIIFTSVNDDVNDPDDMPWNTTNEWGGIAILGNAPINVTGGEDVFEAIPAGDDQELGKYGGDDENDSSGRMEYVSIRHGGAEVATDKEMNGLSLAGVGRGTKLSHIEVFSSSDDAFEWWGGTVNADHLVAAFCQDESYDLDEGNQSRLQFIFAIRNSVKQHIGEHDGAPADTPGNEPKAYTQIYNATYLGGGIEGTDEKSMFRLRENWGGAYKNCIFGDYHGTAVKIDSGVTTPDSYDRLMAGELLFNNNLFYNFSVGSDWASLCEGGQFVVDYFSDASNGNTFGDPLFMSISRANDDNTMLDPRPKVGSPVYDDLAAYPEDDEFFTLVDYKGAFDSENWMVEWTALEHYGFLSGDNYTNVENDKGTASLPTLYGLSQNYPNPFNPTTTINYSIKSEGHVNLVVFNQLGQKVADLVNNQQSVGNYQVSWDASSFPSGIYFYRLNVDGQKIQTRKMLLVK